MLNCSFEIWCHLTTTDTTLIDEQSSANADNGLTSNHDNPNAPSPTFLTSLARLIRESTPKRRKVVTKNPGILRRKARTEIPTTVGKSTSPRKPIKKANKANNTKDATATLASVDKIG